jgi:hypothetical protein
MVNAQQKVIPALRFCHGHYKQENRRIDGIRIDLSIEYSVPLSIQRVSEKVTDFRLVNRAHLLHDSTSGLL